MPTEQEFDDQFDALRSLYKGRKKNELLRDIQGAFDDDEKIKEIMMIWQKERRYLAVSGDRRKNDSGFSYSDFDMLLVTLDRLSGGHGIYKPTNQIRALSWNNTKGDLARVISYFSRVFPQLAIRRFVILPFPTPPIGRNIDKMIHKK